MNARVDPATIGLPKTMNILRLGAVFGLDRVASLRAFDGLMKNGVRVSVSEAVEALRNAGLDPQVMRRQISLSDPVAATTLLVAEQVRMRISPREAHARSGVSESTIRTWRNGSATPTLGRFIEYAAALSYDVILVKSPSTGKAEDEINLSDQRAAMDRLFTERARMGMSIVDLEIKSGMASKSLCSWKNCSRRPDIANLAALACVLGFEIVLRRRS